MGDKMYTTDMYEGMIAETININGHNNDQINAYFARPINSKAVPGIVLIHHLPGWDEWYRETTRKFAHHGFAAISPNLYFHNPPPGHNCHSIGINTVWRTPVLQSTIFISPMRGIIAKQ